MKKVFAVMAVVLCFCFLFSGCNKNRGNGSEDDKIGLKDILKDAKVVNMQGIAAFGISKVNRSSNASNTSISAAAMSSTQKDNSDNILVAVTEDGDIEEVVFEKDGEEIEQKDIGYIYKMYVDSRFTYICYTIYPKTEFYYDSEDYMKSSYPCSKDKKASEQSFVIHNDTGNVYALGDIPNSSDYFDIDIFDGGIKVKDYSGGGGVNYGTYYKLTVKNNELHLENIMPNKEIWIEYIRSDKFGALYVRNSGIDSVENGNVYYTDDYYSNMLCLGSDGRMYRVSSTFNYVYTIKFYDETCRLTNIESDLNVSFSDYWGRYKFVIKNGYLFNADNGIHTYAQTTQGVFEEAKFDYKYEWSDNIYQVWYPAYEIKNGIGSYVVNGELLIAKNEDDVKKLYHVDLNGFDLNAYDINAGLTEEQIKALIDATIKETEVEELRGFSKIKENKTSLMITKNTLFSSTNYLLTYVNGVWQCEETGSSSFSGEILVLMPIN